MLCGRNRETGEEAANNIRRSGGEAAFIRADVSKAAEVEGLINGVIAKYDRLDCAFNNAGTIGPMGQVSDCTEEDWDNVININLKGIWLSMKYELRQMAKQGAGAIVNCSSAAGLFGVMEIAPYVATKHGILGLTKSVALEFAKAGIRINAICPGCMDTPMTQQFFPNNPDGLAQFIDAMQPIGRIGKPEEVAEAVVRLCSDAASFVTGIAMSVDGGMAA